MIVLIYAHPYPLRSRANRVLLEAARGVPELEVRSLYDLYPDFAIDTEAEQRALRGAHTVVWQHPIYWYSVPPLLKLWFDKVLAHGFAYGEGGDALRGKRCQWVITTGGDAASYDARGMHGYAIESFAPPVEQTAKFCGMRWEAPIVLQGAHHRSPAEMADAVQRYRDRLLALDARESGEVLRG